MPPCWTWLTWFVYRGAINLTCDSAGSSTASEVWLQIDYEPSSQSHGEQSCLNLLVLMYVFYFVEMFLGVNAVNMISIQ